MALVKRKPLGDMETIRRDIENIFDETLEWPRRSRLWFSPWFSRRWMTSATFMPTIDMYDKKDEIVIKAELPGVEKKDVDISVTDDTLTIKGRAEGEEEVKDEDYYCCERSYGSFSRSIDLPVSVQVDKVKANFKNGMVEIHLPKAAKTKGIKVQVK
ncbi:MAG: Hsp20 family protein [Candidatus Aenigmarchaeota archaeon]|nr:Hsp20 family protein [Candidatus Aenigmarchaeota archaeon]